MATQESMLKKVRDAVSDLRSSSPPLPEVPKVWPLEGLAIDELANRFRTNLEAVAGEVVFCNNLTEATNRITELLTATDSHRLAVLDHPLSRDVAERLESEGKELMFAPTDATAVSAETLATFDAALMSPELLLCDTGSCLFTAQTTFDRLTTYITPLSIAIASRSMLRENLPQAWAELKDRFETPQTGEFVIVTGPSRTADIEKILILGVHGPKRLVVLLVDEFVTPHDGQPENRCTEAQQ